VGKCALVTLLIQLLAIVSIARGQTEKADSAKVAKPAFSFADVKYYHRWTQGDQHEFTPEGQTDLDAWTDMVTIWRYPTATDGDGLAKVANTVLSNYAAAHGKVIRTSSVPRAKDAPAEHFVAVLFGEPNFYEVAFACFKMHDGLGAGIVYSRRIYGKEVGDKMRDWISKNAPATEKALMKWDEFPKLDTLK
jgi:hypothetical protein